MVVVLASPVPVGTVPQGEPFEVGSDVYTVVANPEVYQPPTDFVLVVRLRDGALFQWNAGASVTRRAYKVVPE
jgi:hypothetical protein